jgi:CTP:molybdopterin cytidylyltransferase MocA
LVLPCDQYRILPVDLRALRDRWQIAPSTPCLSAAGDYAGPPAILPLELYPRVRQLHGDAGARALVCGPAAPPTHRVTNARAIFDLDSPDDLPLANAWVASFTMVTS